MPYTDNSETIEIGFLVTRLNGTHLTGIKESNEVDRKKEYDYTISYQLSIYSFFGDIHLDQGQE